MNHRLSASEINERLTLLNNWVLDAHKASIRREWEFDCFKTAMNFFVDVGELAEDLNHHPEFLSKYTKVSIRLLTHDAYGLTHKDFELAMRIEQLINHKFLRLLKID